MSSADLVRTPKPSLRRVALESIAYGLTHRRALPVDLADSADHPEAWRERSACFVTLRTQGRLRGCTGSLEATQPLVVDVAANAYSAAFRDPRFASVTHEEFPLLDVSISVLSPRETFGVASEADLLARLRPAVDGLVLWDGNRRATLLPAVWKSLPEPADFLEALREKAGLPSGYWSPTLRFERYTVTEAD